MGVEQFGRTMKDIKPGALWGLCQILRLGISRCPALQLLEHNFPAQRQTIREHTDTQMVRVILILKILFHQLLHGFKLFHLVSDFQNSFCF